MRSGPANPIVKEGEKVSRVLLKITQARAGSATIVDAKGKLKGIFTDGDLRRNFEIDKNLPQRRIKEVMTKNPTVVYQDMLALEALRILREKRIDELPVVDKNKHPVGLLDVQDLLKAGLV
jgi:arabinose-5-phosphate isomerase